MGVSISSSWGMHICIYLYTYVYCIYIYGANDVRVSDAFVVRYDPDGGQASLLFMYMHIHICICTYMYIVYMARRAF